MSYFFLLCIDYNRPERSRAAAAIAGAGLPLALGLSSRLLAARRRPWQVARLAAAGPGRQASRCPRLAGTARR